MVYRVYPAQTTLSSYPALGTPSYTWVHHRVHHLLYTTLLYSTLASLGSWASLGFLASLGFWEA